VLLLGVKLYSNAFALLSYEEPYMLNYRCAFFVFVCQGLAPIYTLTNGRVYAADVGKLLLHRRVGTYCSRG